MKERGLGMCAEMVRATLAGLKCVTRRLLKVGGVPARGAFWDHGGWTPRVQADSIEWHSESAIFRMPLKCPQGVKGDRLYLKEAFRYLGRETVTGGGWVCRVQYLADDTLRVVPWKKDGAPPEPKGRVVSGRFMPRCFSRLDLELTCVGLERVQEIMPFDAECEGVQTEDADDVAAFEALWNRLHTEDGERWRDNPWVWVEWFHVVGTIW